MLHFFRFSLMKPCKHLASALGQKAENNESQSTSQRALLGQALPCITLAEVTLPASN